MDTIPGTPFASPRPPAIASRVAIVAVRGDVGRDGHEFATLEALARRIARLRGCEYEGVHAGQPHAEGCHAYLVPDDTLLAEDADALGIAGPGDLYGGVVPHAFVATKIISHEAARSAPVPEGWAHRLAGNLRDVVLPGAAVFSAGDARRAFRRLSPLGPLRLKLARGAGVQGQFLFCDRDALERALDRLPEHELETHGAVLELHLNDAVTFSIGAVECAGMRISYAGTQRTTRTRDGGDAYGGSDLLAARGNFRELYDAGLPARMRRGFVCARAYHLAVREAYPGFFASRYNYDVVFGRDGNGDHRYGVLEQSWRIGGATPAELAALEAFAADPRLRVVRTSCHEVHGRHSPPADAVVHYRAVDPRWGRITKYSLRHADGYAA